MAARELIQWGAVASVAGIAVSLVVEPLLGGVALIVGLACSALGLHRLGRSGSDAGTTPPTDP